LTLEQFAALHPALAEEEAVARLGLFSRRIGIPVYAVHLSSAAGVEALARIRRDNPLLLGETTSPYLTAEGPMGLLQAMSPPIRGGENREALWRAVADGTLSAIGTDNVTLTLKEKEADGVGALSVIPGYPALETHVPSVITEALAREIPLERVLSAMTDGPAKAYGVYPQKGSLLPGADGDLAVVDIQTCRVVRARELHSRSDFSLFEGRALRGWPAWTVKGGVVVYGDGAFRGKGPARCLRR
jgi:dihydropyrimidinase